MHDNLCKTDRAIRLFLGPMLIAYGYWANNWLACIGVWLFMTVFSGWCPVYSIFGFSTAPKDESSDSDKVDEPESDKIS